MLTRVVLWRAEFRTNAYTDQCGLYHSGHVVLEEIEAKITDSRIVKGDYSGEFNPNQIGYRARSVVDGRLFECNWDLWSDTNSSPYWLWFELNANRTAIISEWYNAENVAGRRGHPYVQDNQLKIPPLPYCEAHMMCYNEGAPHGCYRCEIERLREERESLQEKNSG
jgi:hypothetical protein